MVPFEKMEAGYKKKTHVSSQQMEKKLKCTTI